MSCNCSFLASSSLPMCRACPFLCVSHCLTCDHSLFGSRNSAPYHRHTDGSAKLSGRDYEFQEPTLRRESTVRRESLKGESRGDREVFQPDDSKDDAEIRNDIWSIQGDFIYRHHFEPRVQLCVPREESFPVPLKYIDVTRSTHTDLDVAQGKRIDDYWNVVENRSLSDSWTGRFHKIYVTKRDTSEMIYVIREETDKNSNDITSRSHMA